jgi:hypothetical protein
MKMWEAWGNGKEKWGGEESLKKRRKKTRKTCGEAINELVMDDALMIEALVLPAPCPMWAALDEFPKHGTEQDSTQTRTQ